MTVVEIPFQPFPQTVSVTLSGVTYHLKLYWNVPAQCWILDFSDVNGNPIAQGVALVTGVDLLGQYGYLGFGGQLLVASTQKPPSSVPGWGDLGVTGHVYWVSP